MSILDLDDLLNDLENAVEQEKERGKVLYLLFCFWVLSIVHFLVKVFCLLFILVILERFYSARERALVTMIWALLSQTHTLKITHHTCHQK